MYEAARETDQIKHSGAAVGTGIGTALEVAAGVAALVPGPGDVVAVVLAVLGIAALAVPILGGLIHYNAGPIKTGAKRVFIGGKAAARAEIDVVGCDAPKVIAQGSKTVAIEDYPAARIDDQTQCGGSIGEGFPTVFIGREPATYVHIDSEVPLWLQIAYVVASFSVLAGGGIKALLGAGEQELVETGARTVLKEAEWEAADAAYDEIRASTTDVARIAENTGFSEADVSLAKDHVFYTEHQLDAGVGRFDADPYMANAWNRLAEGTSNENDLTLLRHEIYEANFERTFQSTYRDAHEAAEAAGYVWRYEP